jgi:hypothetical protein
VFAVKERCARPSESVAKGQGIAFPNQSEFSPYTCAFGYKKERNKVNSEIFMIDCHRALVRKECPKDFTHRPD